MQPPASLKNGSITVGISGFDRFIDHYLPTKQNNVQLKVFKDPVSIIAFFKVKFTGRPLSATDILGCIHVNPGIFFPQLLLLTNTLSLSWKPWVVMFEHYLPRWNKDSTLGIHLLANSSCKRIIAMSEYALRTQEAFLSRFPQKAAAIRPKLTLVYPAQAVLVSSEEKKGPLQGDIRLVFVGDDFFRKGGRELMSVFERLIREGEHLHLSIVSSMEIEDYASKSTEDDRRNARSTLEELENHVTHLSAIPHDQVLHILRNSDLALLPTYDDTFGFFVLEAQAAACPVITTRCCAMPEINNEECGWLIDIPVDNLGTAIHGTAEERATLSKVIEDGLYAILKGICKDPSVIRQKGHAALKRISKSHDPELIGTAMEAIYRESLRDFPNS